MDDDTTTKDDQYLTDVLSYSEDRLAKERFFYLLLFRSFLLLLLRYRYRLHRSLSFSISTIDLQIQSGFGDVNASREYDARVRILANSDEEEAHTIARFSSLLSILMTTKMKTRLPSNDDEY